MSSCLPYHTDNNFCRLCAPFTPSTTSFRQTLNSPGVAYFDFGHNEYFIATNNIETMVSPNDAIVKLAGVTDIHHATNSLGVVTLHVDQETASAGEGRIGLFRPRRTN